MPSKPSRLFLYPQARLVLHSAMVLATLTTDFGTKDWFVGVMKGVLLNRQPACRIIDLTHDIPPGDIRSAAFVLRSSYRFFPAETVHLAVVDPGVGGPRRAIAVKTRHGIFLGPDNGVLSWAVQPEEVILIAELQNPQLCLRPVSATFHGRDVFAPMAAHLLAGGAWTELGPNLHEMIRLPWPSPKFGSHSIETEVLHVDHFGNAITGLDVLRIPTASPRLRVQLSSGLSVPLAPFYQAVPSGHPVAVSGSCGLLEIGVNGGSAASQMRLKPGSPVVVRWD